MKSSGLETNCYHHTIRSISFFLPLGDKTDSLHSCILGRSDTHLQPWLAAPLWTRDERDALVRAVSGLCILCCSTRVWRDTWPGESSSWASAADVSEGTIWFGAPGIKFTIWMDKKAFVPKFTVGKGPLGKGKTLIFKLADAVWTNYCKEKSNSHLHCVVGWWYKHSSPLLQTGQNLHLSSTFCFFKGTPSSITPTSIMSSG